MLTTKPLESPRFNRAVSLELGRLFGGGGWTYNMAPNPVSLSMADIPSIRERISYFVSKKADGTRYLLLLSSLPLEDKVVRYAVFIDRRLRCYSVQLTARAELFDGTIFDGELVRHVEKKAAQFLSKAAPAVASAKKRGGPSRTFWAFDCAAFGGRSVAGLPYANRMSYAQRVADFPANDFSLLGIKFAVKPFAPVAGLRELLAIDGEHLPWDGLVFTPAFTPIILGTHRTMFKWKKNHTLDLRLHGGSFGVEFELYYAVHRGGGLTECKDPIVTLDGLKLVLRLNRKGGGLIDKFSRLLPPDNRYINCSAEFVISLEAQSALEVHVVCMPIRLRPDKETPNHMQTVIGTWNSMRDNISLDLLTAPDFAV